MHPKTPKWLQDVLDACDLIVRACEGHTRESFTQNELLKGAVERKFEIIGEALSRISKTDSFFGELNWGQSTFLDSRRSKTLAGYRLLPI
jgi:uncharacterized protein with HEPN domain